MTKYPVEVARTESREAGGAVRPILENSTACTHCQMPNYLAWWCPFWMLQVFFGLMDRQYDGLLVWIILCICVLRFRGA
ncbi:hypothetical protein [Pseudoclavibacter endophyticus]|uniref:Uncharacterized protein n=1 Tax=Pseudoclavibacter endophyticus TaxID=1778590 RepID=A0A6H9WJT2_9MICO|nr:hypothetical protein [Pseudoclavibacter endophyticus]KAB1647909.1 hypothetical protein F8O04_12945 [Pseudoclavibacter endophyticus]